MSKARKSTTPAPQLDDLGLGLYPLKVKRLHPDAQLPRYATPGAACFDLHACMRESLVIDGRTRGIVGTGLAFEVPPGHVLLVYSRSGDGFRHGVRLSNSVGVIDSDYRGEVMVALTNDSRRDFAVSHGDRIAQAMLVPLPSVVIEEVDELSTTARGAGGLGSTGK